MKALVLAAGKGSRIARVAKGLPKPLLEIAGEPVLVHNLRLLARHGVRGVWINLHERAGDIRAWIGNGNQWRVRVSYSLERTLLGTAGAARKLLRRLGPGDFLVLYGDNYTDCDLSQLAKTHHEHAAAVTIAAFDPKRNPNSGVAGGRMRIGANGRVKDFIEGGRTRGGWVNAGIYAVNPKALKGVPSGFSDFGRDVFPDLLRKGEKIYAYRMKGFCLALDTPAAYRTALRKAAAFSKRRRSGASSLKARAADR